MGMPSDREKHAYNTSTEVCSIMNKAFLPAPLLPMLLFSFWDRGKKIWSYEDARISIIYRFNDLFQEIRQKARIKQHKTFHDIRRTAITNWFYEGLEINEVMRVAGHSKYETCLKYYLSVKDDLMNKARKAVKYRVGREMLERCLGE